MGILRNLFASKDAPVENYADFWNWFVMHEAAFHKIIRSNDISRIENGVFDPVSGKLARVKDGFFLLAGMLDDSTADLVFTADGNPKNIPFVEELVQAAPKLTGWQFTPLKHPVDRFGMRMNGIDFDQDSLSFFPTEHAHMPDLVDITIVHDALEGPSADSAKHGIYIFLDNFLGELNFLTSIDDLNFSGPNDAASKLIPIEALPNYLETRQTLFVEKYEGVRIFTDSDNYSLLEGQLENGRRMVATVNTDLLGWDKKASHPWMLVVNIPFDGEHFNGLPDQDIAEKLNEIEHAISDELKDVDGYLNVGRQVANSERLIFFACVEFRMPAKVMYEIQKRYKGAFNIDYEIIKDKYWQTVRHLQPA